MTDEITIGISDLSPGDRILRWRLIPFTSWCDCTIVEPDLWTVGEVRGRCVFNVRRALLVVVRGPHNLTAEFVVERAAAMPTASKRLDTGWNGRCPRCSANTYTSCFRIEHEGECRP